MTRGAPLAALCALCACDVGGVPPPPKPLGPPAPLSAPRDLTAVLHTGAGDVRCVLEADRAPGAASMFAGFATGTAEWLDPSGERVKRPLYLDLAFHRAIEGVLVQTGCPRGDGTGHPGYRIALELHPSDEARLREPGALVMATYTPPPGRDDPAPPPPDHVIGSQFGILLGDSRHLAGDVTVLGRCADLDVVRRIAATDAARRPRLVSVAVADRAPR